MNEEELLALLGELQSQNNYADDEEGGFGLTDAALLAAVSGGGFAANRRWGSSWRNELRRLTKDPEVGKFFLPAKAKADAALAQGGWTKRVEEAFMPRSATRKLHRARVGRYAQAEAMKQLSPIERTRLRQGQRAEKALKNPKAFTKGKTGRTLSPRSQAAMRKAAQDKVDAAAKLLKTHGGGLGTTFKGTKALKSLAGKSLGRLLGPASLLFDAYWIASTINEGRKKPALRRAMTYDFSDMLRSQLAQDGATAASERQLDQIKGWSHFAPPKPPQDLESLLARHDMSKLMANSNPLPKPTYTQVMGQIRGGQ